jgi:hypothetical protein
VSTASVDNPAETSNRRSTTSRQRPLQDANRPELTAAREHTEAAVTDLVSATSDALRAFLPVAVVRPTEAIDYVFDVVEQVVIGMRRVCVEIAGVVESGLQAAERRAA